MRLAEVLVAALGAAFLRNVLLQQQQLFEGAVTGRVGRAQIEANAG